MRLVRSGLTAIIVVLLAWLLVGFVAFGFYDQRSGLMGGIVTVAWWLVNVVSVTSRRGTLFILGLLNQLPMVNLDQVIERWNQLFADFWHAANPPVHQVNGQNMIDYAPHVTWAYVGLVFWPLLGMWIMVALWSLLFHLLLRDRPVMGHGGSSQMSEPGGHHALVRGLVALALVIMAFWGVTRVYEQYIATHHDTPLSQATQDFTFLDQIGFATPACQAATKLTSATTHDDSRNMLECARTLSATLSRNTSVDSGLIIRPQDYVTATTFVESVLAQADLLPGLSAAETASLAALTTQWQHDHQLRVSAANETIIFLYGQWRLDQQSGQDVAVDHEIESSLNYACSRLPAGTTKTGDEVTYQEAVQRCDRFSATLEPHRSWLSLLGVAAVAVIVIGSGGWWWRRRRRDAQPRLTAA